MQIEQFPSQFQSYTQTLSSYMKSILHENPLPKSYILVFVFHI